jgi:hypothetical protein
MKVFGNWETPDKGETAWHVVAGLSDDGRKVRYSVVRGCDVWRVVRHENQTQDVELGTYHSANAGKDAAEDDWA